MRGFTLTKDSKLIETYWKYDKEKEEGEFKTREINHITAHVLHESNCHLEDGVTLRNILEFMNSVPAAWQIFIGNWCEEFIAEGLKSESKRDTRITYLELYWSYQINEYSYKEEPQLSFGYRMDFHAKTIPDEQGWDNYSLSFTPVNEIADVPVKVNEEVILYETEYITYKSKQRVLGKQCPTLFQIIYGIIWELSFHGSPISREEEKMRIDVITQDLKKEGKDFGASLEKLKI